MPVHFQAPIVGGRFRPPAETILSLLPAGCSLFVQREPENPYDENAIKIVIPALADAFPDIFEAAKKEMEERGLYDEDVGLPEDFHLGYVPRELAEKWRETIDNANTDSRPVIATLVFSTSGKPEVLIEIGD